MTAPKPEPVSEHDHSDLFDFDCQSACPTCGAFGPHKYFEDAYCDLCGQPHADYYNAIRKLVSRG